MTRIVLDTNVLISAIPEIRTGSPGIILDRVFDRAKCLFVSLHLL